MRVLALDQASRVSGWAVYDGKTLIDYIVQYKSYKVFAAICDEKQFITLPWRN